MAWTTPRFVAGSGTEIDCITDSLTSLMWMRFPNNIVINWMTALTSTNSLTLCGHSDWRLPNINELESLVNSEVVNSAAFLNTQGFNGVEAILYWSSTGVAESAGSAWIVDMFS